MGVYHSSSMARTRAILEAGKDLSSCTQKAFDLLKIDLIMEEIFKYEVSRCVNEFFEACHLAVSKFVMYSLV